MAHTAVPLVVAAIVVATVCLASPMGAWLPLSSGPAMPDAWEAPAAWPAGQISGIQIALGALASSTDPVSGAIVVAALTAALAASMLVVALRRSGLRGLDGALLALVAVASPVAAWQASSPLGASLVTLVATACLWTTVLRSDKRCSRRISSGGQASLTAGQSPAATPWVGTAAAPWWLLLVVVIVAGEAWGYRAGTSTLAQTATLLRGELGLPGLLLALLAATRVGHASHDARVWRGGLIALCLTMTMAPHVRVAALAPWVWWIVAAGLTRLREWRGPTARVWTHAGLAIWLLLLVSRIPWTHDRQQVSLTRPWAEAVAARLSHDTPLVDDGSARAALVQALAATRAQRLPPTAAITPDVTWTETHAGRRPLIVSASAVETLARQGVGFEPVDDVAVSLDALLTGLPAGTVVYAAMSSAAAAAVTPPQWQALGRLGLRMLDVRVARAHVVAGATGARAEALEDAQADRARLDIQPGDPLGRTDVLSPLDVRLQADATHASVALRGRVLAQADGVVVLIVTTRGHILTWRAGTDASHLTGPALGAGVAVPVAAFRAEPCIDVPPGAQTDITAVTASGLLGMTWSGAGQVELAVRDLDGNETRVHAAADRAETTALRLDTIVTQATAQATHPVRVCTTWPVAIATSLRRSPLVIQPTLAQAAYFGAGWHLTENEGPGRWFRWMAGPRADIVVALRDAAETTITLDAQPPARPTPTDTVSLVVNGVDAGTLSMLDVHGPYRWTIPAANMRAGMNRLSLRTSLVVQPAAPGTDGDTRTLGLLVREVAVGPAVW